MTTQTALATETTVPAILPLAQAATALSRLRAYVEAEGDDLIACCAWLGGPKWTLMAETLTLAALRSEPLGGWQRRVLEGVHGLLSLERVDDPEDTEAGSFVCFDMADERIHSCCRHTEALGAILRHLRAEELAARQGRRENPAHAPAA